MGGAVGVGQVVQWVFDVGRWEAGVGRGGAVGSWRRAWWCIGCGAVR